MTVNLAQAKEQSALERLFVSVPLAEEQQSLIFLLNDFAIHQAEYNSETRQFPAKMMYKVNEELKLALVAILTTCALLDPLRHGNETQAFFERQVKINQKIGGEKTIDFGVVRPDLVQKALFPEVVEDWILYRDVNGDGIHALMDRKTYLQGLSSYVRGGHPVYEFARFYRCFMKEKIAKRMHEQKRVQEIAIKSLTDQVIRSQLEQGVAPQEILDGILSGNTSFLSAPQSDSHPLRLTKK